AQRSRVVTMDAPGAIGCTSARDAQKVRGPRSRAPARFYARCDSTARPRTHGFSNALKTRELETFGCDVETQLLPTGSSKRAELPSCPGVRAVLMNWLAVRDDFRNWLI